MEKLYKPVNVDQAQLWGVYQKELAAIITAEENKYRKRPTVQDNSNSQSNKNNGAEVDRQSSALHRRDQ